MTQPYTSALSTSTSSLGPPMGVCVEIGGLGKVRHMRAVIKLCDMTGLFGPVSWETTTLPLACTWKRVTSITLCTCVNMETRLLQYFLRTLM